MKILIVLCLAFLFFSIFMALANNAHAAWIQCYSNGKTIYSGSAKDVTYDDKFLIFTDNKTGRDVFIKADCVVRV